VEYLEFAIDLARQAGEVLKHYADREKFVELKGRANLVTAADKESEALIIDAIRKRYPHHAILAEESGALSGSGPAAAKWVIDPLDGTTNFAHQYPFYCVSIALEQEGVVTCGVVYDPVRDELFSGAAGLGSFMNGKPLAVSDASKLSDALLITGFPYNMRDNMDQLVGDFRAFLNESQAVRRGGSAALDLCYVALGRCDGFWELNLHPWDTAAGKVILEEAGGRITDFRGGPFSIYLKQIVASNSRIHDEMLRVLVHSNNDHRPVV
jgi:myo-inositol-1(or 4)-monophosphatase